jgi:hypothetical protein
MKKSFIFIALMACVAVCGVSCGSDDDNSSSKEITLKKTPYEEQAVTFIISPSQSSNINKSKPGAPDMESIDISENGDVIITLTSTDGDKSYSHTTVTSYNNNNYTLGNGHLQLLDTRANSTQSSVTIAFEITINGVVYSTDNLLVAALYAQYANGSLENYLCRRWDVTGMRLTLTPQDGGTPAGLTWPNANLANVSKELTSHSVNLTAAEKEQLNRTLSGIFIEGSGRGFLYYGNDAYEVFTWNAITHVTENGQVKFNFPGESGNKFFNEASAITVSFEGNTCQLKLKCVLQGDKLYNTEFVLQLTGR